MRVYCKYKYIESNKNTIYQQILFFIISQVEVELLYSTIIASRYVSYIHVLHTDRIKVRCS